MRDPLASVLVGASDVVRVLRAGSLPDTHLLRTPLVQRWVSERRLVPFEIGDAGRTLISTRIDFVTFPDEWCDSQLFSAAQLTLDLQREALTHGFDLKDASAWNVLFDGTRPIFCDLLSFEPLAQRAWWAAGQFSRHFISPLLLAHQRGLHGMEAFRVWRDGVPPGTMRRMLGVKRFLTRYWPLFADVPRRGVELQEVNASQSDLQAIVSFRGGLDSSLRWMLNGVRPVSSRGVGWSAYVEDRGHYDEASLKCKRETVASWLASTRPAWVADLGSNTGEFSRIAADAGARVIAVDSDHAAVERMFLASPGDPQVHPVVATLDDLTGGRGWGGSEHGPLVGRIAERCDLLMILALVHHLAIAASIPLEQIAALARRLTKRWVIVELIDSDDPQLLRLCSQRKRSAAEFSITRQREAFIDAGFRVENERLLAPTHRRLLLLSCEQTNAT